MLFIRSVSVCCLYVNCVPYWITHTQKKMLFSSFVNSYLIKKMYTFCFIRVILSSDVAHTQVDWTLKTKHFAHKTCREQTITVEILLGSDPNQLVQHMTPSNHEFSSTLHSHIWFLCNFLNVSTCDHINVQYTYGSFDCSLLIVTLVLLHKCTGCLWRIQWLSIWQHFSRST